MLRLDGGATCLHIRPRGVRVFILRTQFHRLPVLLIHNLHVKLLLVGRHSLSQVRAHLVRTEVQHRQANDAIDSIDNNQTERHEGDEPFRSRTKEVLLQLVVSADQHCCTQQHDVLSQRSSIAQYQHITKAPAVFHRVGNGYIDRQQRHHHHKGKRDG